MNLGLVPLWILSGAAFPATGAAPWVRALMSANPLTYGVAALRHVLSPAPLPGEPSLGMCLLVVALFGVVTLCLSTCIVRRDTGSGPLSAVGPARAQRHAQRTSADCSLPAWLLHSPPADRRPSRGMIGACSIVTRS